ncbi:MAG: alkaline phosphatase [Kiritimatiellaeota bacterium]|nr:alkaline phosphatase [Kiritimatiellota bacterium]
MKFVKFMLAAAFSAVVLFGSTTGVYAATPQNVILIIGDGMGRGALDLASLRKHGDTGKLFMQSLPVSGLCRTHSINSPVTDSAAAATALACGEKTNNGVLGLTTNGIPLKSVAFLAKERGKTVGLVTSDSIIGATPAGFYAHRASRMMFDEIAADLADCGFDILIGGEWSRNFITNHTAKFKADGYALIESAAEFAAAPADAKILGQFSDSRFWNDEMMLATLTTTAIARLENASTNGFFLMVESSYTDNGGHGNDAKSTVLGVTHADHAVKAAVDYASTRDDTLVILTADHETGGLVVMKNPAESKKPFYVYYTVNHSAEPVPLYAFGAGAENFSGVLDNTEIGRKIAEYLKAD